MAIPSAERPPKGLNADWLGVWRHALKALKDQGTWCWEQRPLLDEYVYALRAAEDARVGFGWLDKLEEEATESVDLLLLKQIATGLPAQWDRHVKRANQLAHTLLLTEKARKEHGLSGNDDGDTNSSPMYDAAPVSLAEIRRRRAS